MRTTKIIANFWRSNHIGRIRIGRFDECNNFIELASVRLSGHEYTDREATEALTKARTLMQEAA
jgi:hypothetical protein